MAIFLIILSCVLWIISIYTLSGRQVLSAPLSFLALLALSFAKRGGYQLIPINITILIWWLCMTLVVTFAVYLQPEPVRRQTRGSWYIVGGAITGMVVGLLAFTFSTLTSVLYASMMLGTVAGTFFGFYLYTTTKDGSPIGIRSGNFFRYLLAKGFPAAITVMQIGVALVLTLVVNNAG